MKNSKAFKRLCEIKPIRLGISDLSDESRKKVFDTIEYAMDANGESDKRTVAERCVIAMLAEQYVAQWLKGFVMHGEENLDDPWTYAFDVLGGPEYNGIRVEVKTHQASSKYVVINTGHTPPFVGTTGLNVRPFLELKIADVLLVFDTKADGDKWLFEPYFLCDRDSLVSPGVTKKSKFNGHYINFFLPKHQAKELNIFYHKQFTQL
ncbi:DenB-like DNA endonuclease IV [Acinetobacter phage Acj9]|uniref:DenB DNA endonuclease IV n=1 Tax=Acinetobacter phage Acj9 TaxID=760939 RepID=E5EQ36_9CAUD|nr:DenB-like DNA endonuclease IV [Acinetobacter phage Acj9]ADG60152.1 DenB DNA endonuclease IV [Acinetobacter phage Acj9]